MAGKLRGGVACVAAMFRRRNLRRSQCVAPGVGLRVFVRACVGACVCVLLCTPPSPLRARTSAQVPAVSNKA